MKNETFTRTALRERSLPFIIKAPIAEKKPVSENKMNAFARLEAARKANSVDIDYNSEREAAMNEKYGIID